QELVHGLLLVEIVNYGRVLARQRLELLFAPGIGQAAAIENKSAAISGFVFGQAAMKRETPNPHDQSIRLGSQALQLLRAQHAVKSVHQSGKRDRQRDIVQQPAQVFQRVGHALQKMRFALVEPAEPVGPQGLHDADIDVGVVIVQEHIALQINKPAQSIEIVVEQL